MREKTNQILKTFIGKKLIDIHLVCEMMCFDFGDVGFHAQGFTRIIQNDEILVTTADYQHWDQVESENNDEWYNIAQYKDRIINNIIERIELSPVNDMFIYLSNGICIQAFAEYGSLHFCDYCEQWRFLVGLNNEDNDEDNDAEPLHIVAEGKEIRFSE